MAWTCTTARCAPRLTGSRMQIDELTFEGGTGSRAYVRGFSGNRTPPPTARGRMTVTGSIDWSRVEDASAAESGIAMDLEAETADACRCWCAMTGR